MQNWIKNIGGHFLSLVIFGILSIAYFSPVFFDNKAIIQSDTQKFEGMAQELLTLREKGQDNEIIAWLGNMFSGMPSYHVTVNGNPTNAFSYIGEMLSFLDYFSIRILFLFMVCFYILMSIMKVNRWLAIAGAIAYAFASYNIIIIEGGHITKAYVMAYMPLTIGGIILIFRNKIFWGSILYAFGVAISIKENHLQITYYLALLCLFIYGGYTYQLLKNKDYKIWIRNSLLMIVCTGFAILPSSSNLYSSWELGKTSTRGATELKTISSEGEKISSGLDKEYAFQWSYGKGELLTILIPNAYGGSSNSILDNKSQVYKTLKGQGMQLGKEIQAPVYWGDKPFTQGPVYFGAIICFLFILGMFVIRNTIKWWLFAATVFFIFLSLGKNLDWFNDFMFHYLPMYNKFRTVEMALVIPGLIFPFIAFWGLKEIFTGVVKENILKKGLFTALGITGGICLLIWMIPDLFLSFQSPNDSYYGYPTQALIADRESLASSDALRSLIFILLSGGLIYWFIKTKNKAQASTIISIGLIVLVLIDLWTIDKRYLNNNTFTKQKIKDTYSASLADQEILQDKDPSYRVLNLNNPFLETNTAYFHKSIGGYHAAKLRRYQELIDYRLSKEINNIINTLQKAQSLDEVYTTLANSPSLNMLNTRYIIYNPTQPPLLNPFAYGNAWFIKEIEIVENADAEIAALDRIKPLETAIIDKRFENEVKDFIPTYDETGFITLNSYSPNRMIYTSKTSSERLGVFSEIYYQPGWNVTIDGQPASHFRVDWTLRGMRIPAGEHEIIFEFYPKEYIKAVYIESYSSFLFLFLIIGAIVYSFWKKRKEIVNE